MPNHTGQSISILALLSAVALLAGGCAGRTPSADVGPAGASNLSSHSLSGKTARQRPASRPSVKRPPRPEPSPRRNAGSAADELIQKGYIDRQSRPLNGGN